MAPTAPQPKQVIYSSDKNLAIVSCMKGRVVQFFRLYKDEIVLERQIPFRDQCVELALCDDLVLATTTNFARPPARLRNQLHIISLAGFSLLASVNTGGNWSKVICISPEKKTVLVSNWHSHNISVFDFDYSRKTLTFQSVIPWGEAPRGLAFIRRGDRALVAGFYSGNIGELQRDKSGRWKTVYTSPPFDQPNYPGNLRHIVITPDNQFALVSNLGRNLIHWWSIPERRFVDSVMVGRSPNTICFLDFPVLAVSCRESNAVYFVDVESKEVLGRSQFTGRKPTGLCSAPGGFLVTCFEDGLLEWHRYRGS